MGMQVIKEAGIYRLRGGGRCEVMYWRMRNHQRIWYGHLLMNPPAGGEWNAGAGFTWFPDGRVHDQWGEGEMPFDVVAPAGVDLHAMAGGEFAERFG